MSKEENGVFMQAGILAAAGIAVRIIGLLYRSPLTSIIGDEGNGYYSYAYNCYTILLLISSYSIPSAISKVIAQKLAVREYRNAQRIFRCALLYVCGAGGAAALFAFFGAGLMVPGNSVPVLRVFAPTIFLSGLLGVLRGYYQAHGSMVQTSISQVLEQIANAVVSLLAAWLLIRSVAGERPTVRAIYGAAGSAVGTGAGVLCALLFVAFVYYTGRRRVRRRIREDRHRDEGYPEIFRTIVFVVTPFILSTFIYNCSTMVNQTIYSRVMTNVYHIAQSDAATAYGIFAGKAVIITNIPIAVSAAMSSALIPNISASIARKKRDAAARQIARVVRMTMLIAIPSAAGLASLSRPIMLLLFPQRGSLDRAAQLLAGLAITVVFYSLSTVTNAVLQSIGRVNAPVINASAALCVQALVLYLLLQYTALDNFALVVAMIVYSLLMCILNGIAVNRSIRVAWNIRRIYLMPAVAAAVMGGGCAVLCRLFTGLAGRVISSEYLTNLVATAAAILIGICIYAAILLKTGTVTKNDLAQFPKGRLLVAAAARLRLL